MRLNNISYDNSSNIAKLQNLSWKTGVKYFCVCLIIVLFASVDKIGGALALGFVAGLFFARQNMLIIYPVYLVSSIAFNFDWWQLLFSGTPLLVFAIVALIFYLIKKNIPIWVIPIATLISLVGFAGVNIAFSANIFNLILYCIIAIVFSLCSAIVGYAVLFRSLNSHFTLDEQICGCIVIVGLSYALASVGYDKFSIVFMLLGFFLVLVADNFKPQTVLIFALSCGVGAGLYFGDLAVCGGIVLLGAVAVALSSFSRFASGLGIIIAQTSMWLLSLHIIAGWESVVLLAIGVFFYLITPKVFRINIKRFSISSNNETLHSVVNRDRMDLSTKLLSVSDVFYDLSKSLEIGHGNARNYNANSLAREISKSYCGRCSDRNECYKQLGGDTTSVLEPMTSAVLNRGKVTILDMPTFITSRCTKMHNLSSVINSAGESYQKKIEQSDGIQLSKKLMSEQFAGIALILDSMAKDCGEQINFVEDINENLKAELLRHNIIASEILISGEGSKCQVAITLRELDAEKRVLPQIVSSKLKIKLEVSEIRPKGEMKVVHFECSPTFELAYGIAEKRREGQSVSGDSRSVLCPSRNKRIFAICDGMGSGETAYKSSQEALSMVENFYRAGFDNAITLSLVNKLLKLNADECFSALDISVIDTITGNMDIIKMGACESFIVHRDCIECVTSTAPPAGILDDVQPITDRVQLYDGDMVVLMSDGVFDMLDTVGVNKTIDELSTKNPQILADELLERAISNGADDDCTVMCFRLFVI